MIDKIVILEAFYIRDYIRDAVIENHLQDSLFKLCLFCINKQLYFQSKAKFSVQAKNINRQMSKELLLNDRRGNLIHGH